MKNFITQNIKTVCDVCIENDNKFFEKEFGKCLLSGKECIISFVKIKEKNKNDFRCKRESN